MNTNKQIGKKRSVEALIPLELQTKARRVIHCHQPFDSLDEVKSGPVPTVTNSSTHKLARKVSSTEEQPTLPTSQTPGESTSNELTPYTITPEHSMLFLSTYAEGRISLIEDDTEEVECSSTSSQSRDVGLDLDRLTRQSSKDALLKALSEAKCPTRTINKEAASVQKLISLRQQRYSKTTAVLFSVTMLCLMVGSRFLQMTSPVIHPDSVFVSGGGFSGFWFSIGRLQSIPDVSSHTYYCYSAGCLAVVAALSHSSLTDIYTVARNVQIRWKEGETRQFDVVPEFLTDFLSMDEVRSLLKQPELLSKMNIITTVPTGWWGVKSVIRTPTSESELYEMLLHTTWIPFATGERLWSPSLSTGENHMDGIFSRRDHPTCAHHVGLPQSIDIFVNALNMDLSAAKVEKFWKQGLEYGL